METETNVLATKRLLDRWAVEDVTLIDFVKGLLNLGWTRRMVYNWLEHDATRNTRYVQESSPQIFHPKRRRRKRSKKLGNSPRIPKCHDGF